VDEEDPEIDPPPDDAPFDLESHPMYREEEWRPFPSPPAFSESFYGRFHICDNGGGVSSVEGFSLHDEEEIVAWLTRRGWPSHRLGIQTFVGMISSFECGFEVGAKFI
jgi:hypothetical protein